MQGFTVLKTVFNKILLTGLTDRVFHSVKRVTNDKGVTYPAYPIQGGREYKHVGIDDTKVMTVYCRQTDDLRAVSESRVSSSKINYRVAIPHRIVFFNDFEGRPHDDLVKMFMQFVFLSKVRLIRVITDKEKLAGMEGSETEFHFDENTFYCAIDFDVLVDLIGDGSGSNCESEIGDSEVIGNPYIGGGSEVGAVYEPEVLKYIQWDYFDSLPESVEGLGMLAYGHSKLIEKGEEVLLDIRDMQPNVFLVVRYPDTEGDFGSYETESEGGFIPDFVFNEPVIVGSKKYLFTRREVTFSTGEGLSLYR